MSDHLNSQASQQDSGASWGVVGLASLVAVALVCGMGYAAFFGQPDVDTGDREQQATAQRLQKVGTVGFQPPAAEASAAADGAATGGDTAAVGESLYKKSCSMCHASGVAGAPKFGDKAAWEARIATGMDAMMQVAINGKGGMPPRGASTASDEDLKAAVQYMVDQVK